MAHQYKRRTYDEAMEIAQKAFQNEVHHSLNEDEIKEVREFSATGGGSMIRDGWSAIIGYEPERRLHYEIQIIKPSKHSLH